MPYALPRPPSGPTCPACGRQMPPTTGVAGRPPETCSPPCRNVWKLVRDAENAIAAIQADATPQGWLFLRGRLWRTMNDRAWNKGLTFVKA